MICSVCKHENESDASFCSNCGSALAVTCTNCGAESTPDSKFCRVCGQAFGAVEQEPDDDLRRYIPEELLKKMRAARAGKTMAGERRTVTMLFADVEGSTAAAETLDPEDWAEVINGAFERLIQPVYRYEGTLARLAGDSVLAFFGAPVAHEDDPERAAMAALEMLKAIPSYSLSVKKKWGISIQVRIGINTGLVVVGEVGSDLRVEYTALGDAINLAARMEQTAAPGTIQITESTHDLIKSHFEMEDVGAVQVKGKEAPVQAYSVVGRKNQENDQTSTVLSPLVGRDAEVGALQEAVSKVTDGGGGIVAILGDAGLGKSRLVAELRSLNSDRIGPWWEPDASPTIGWASGEALSYNNTVPYAPIVDLLKDCLRLPETDTSTSNQSQLQDFVESFTEEPAENLPYLANLLGTEVTPEMASLINGLQAPELQRRTFRAVIRLVESAARLRPTILVFEDLHWADPVSLALIQELMQVTDRAMLLLVITMRSYRDRPSWQIHETAAREFDHRYTPLELVPLQATQTMELVNTLLGEESNEATREQIASKSQGNPFYVQEFLNSLGDHPGQTTGDSDASGDIQVPTSINGLLTARLDRLDPEARLVIQIASVIGREFRFDEVEHLIDDSIELRSVLADLMRRKLLEERVRLPERLFGFTHALLQETAYSSLLRRSRRDLHSQIASYLESAHPDGVQAIANHFMKAHEQGRALPYLVAAGERASRAMSLTDAIKFYNQALAIDEPGEVALLRRAHEGLGAAYTMIPDLTLASAAFQDMLTLGRAESEPTMQVGALNRLGFATAVLGGEFDEASGYLEQARELAEEHGDERGLGEYHMNACIIATQRGDMRTAAEHDAGTALVGSRTGNQTLRMGGLVQRAISFVIGGFFEEGMIAVREARKEAVETGDELSQAILDASVAPYYRLQQGDLAGGLILAKAGAETAERYGSNWAPQSWMSTGYFAAVLGDLEDALASSSRGLRVAEQYNQPNFAAAAAGHLAAMYGAAGLLDKVEENFEIAIRNLSAPTGKSVSSTAWNGLGRAMLDIGEPERALDYFQKSQAPSASQMTEKGSTLLGMAEAHRQLGDLGSAREALATADTFVSEFGMAYLRPAVELAKARLTDGGPETVLEGLQLGIDQAKAMLLDPVLWQLQSELAGALSDLGRGDEAAASLAEAGATISRMAGRIVDPDLRASFRLHKNAKLRQPRTDQKASPPAMGTANGSD